MRNKFLDHPEWPQSPSNNPLWYKELVANFKKEYERNARTWSEEDYHCGSNKIRASTDMITTQTLRLMITAPWYCGSAVTW